MKKIFGLLVLLYISTAAVLPVAAQSPGDDTSKASELEAVINTSVINYAQAAYFVLSSAYAVSGRNSDVNQDTAFNSALEHGWLSKKAAADAPIKLGALSFLIMKSFNMKGGFLYAIFPGSRYAFRELVSLNIIQGVADPSMTISGERFLLILGNALKIMEDKS